MKELVADLAESINPVAFLRRVAEQACLLLPDVDGAAVRLCDGDRSVVIAAHGALGPALGSVSQSGDPDDCRVSMGWPSVLNTPMRRGATLLGWISVVSSKPAAFGDTDVSAMSAVSRFVSTLLTANTELAAQVDELLTSARAGIAIDPAAHLLASLVVPEAAMRRQLRAEITDVAAPDRLCAVFQPVCRLSDLRLSGFEGLTRFPDGSHARPDHWFAKAHKIGRGADLEIMALKAVLESARQIPSEYDVSVNLSPLVAVTASAQHELRSADRPITLELTEHDHITAGMYADLRSLRRDGVRLAIDDTGAGFSSLSRIVRLRPDVIKLDRDLTADVQSDPARQALVVALVHFAREIGAVTVAEGIETADQHATLRDLGIGFGQGFWLGQPRPISEHAPLFA